MYNFWNLTYLFDVLHGSSIALTIEFIRKEMRFLWWCYAYEFT